MQQALREETAPMREAALTRANLGQQVASLESQAGTLDAAARAKVADVRKLVDMGKTAEASAELDRVWASIPAERRVGIPWAEEGAARFTRNQNLGQLADSFANRSAEESLTLGAGSRDAQAAANELRLAGIKPLESQPIVNKILGRINPTTHPEFASRSEEHTSELQSH